MNLSKLIKKEELGTTHCFFIKNLVMAEIDQKLYYALQVEAPSLLELRKKYNLPDLLCFKGYSIGFHITIGVKSSLGIVNISPQTVLPIPAAPQ